MSRRAIDPEEQALWHQVTRDVARHRGGKKVAGKPKPVSPEPPPIVPARAATQESRASLAPDPGLRRNDDIAAKLHTPTPGLDRRNALRLKRGQMAIEGRLDLHGMIQADAHRALASFIARNHAAGKRMLLVITGKGTKEGSGVLRAAVPRWLGEPAMRPRVLAVTPAMPKDGGGGALYILLRRER